MDQIPDSRSLMALSTYAKHRGVSPMAVTRAVKRGRLKASVGRSANGEPKIIDVELADREWEANTDWTKAPAYVKEQAAARAAKAVNATPTIDSPPRPESDPDAPDENTMAGAAWRAKHWDAELKELKFKEAAGELVPAKDVEQRLVDVFSACKTRLLAVTSRAKQALPELSAAQMTVLEDLIREALTDLANSKGKL